MATPEKSISDAEHLKRYIATASLEQRSELLDQTVEWIGKTHPDGLMLVARAMAIILNEENK